MIKIIIIGFFNYLNSIIKYSKIKTPEIITKINNNFNYLIEYYDTKITETITKINNTYYYNNNLITTEESISELKETLQLFSDINYDYSFAIQTQYNYDKIIDSEYLSIFKFFQQKLLFMEYNNNSKNKLEYSSSFSIKIPILNITFNREKFSLYFIKYHKSNHCFEHHFFHKTLSTLNIENINTLKNFTIHLKNSFKY